MLVELLFSSFFFREKIVEKDLTGFCCGQKSLRAAQNQKTMIRIFHSGEMNLKILYKHEMTAS